MTVLTPNFVAQKIVLKREAGTESNPEGPLFYEGENFVTSRVHEDGHWVDLREARKIAAELKLPLDIF